MSARTRAFLGRQWDTLIALVAAAALSILSAFDILAGDAVAASTLAVLALVSVALVKEREGHERVEESVVGLRERLRLRGEVFVLPTAQVNGEFERAMTGSMFWRFKGGTGIYLRAETLPRLAAEATTQREVWIEIIDPSDDEVCELYAEYRRKVASPRSAGNQETWSLHRTRIEAYATVIAAIWFSQHQNLRVHLALASHMSTFRYDMSDCSVFITNEDTNWPAIKAHSRGAVYRRCRDELSYSFDQARRIELREARHLPAREVGGEQVGIILDQLGLVAPDGLTSQMDACSLIAYHAISYKHARRLGLRRGGARNPYADSGGRSSGMPAVGSSASDW